MRTPTSNPTSLLVGLTHPESTGRRWRVWCCPRLSDGQHAWVSRRWRHRWTARFDWWWHRRTHHPYLQRHSQRTRLLWLLVATAVAGAVLLVLTATPAGAHQATLSVSTECQRDGRWVATWRITNDQPRKQMSVEAQDVTGFTSPVGYLGTGRDSTTHANTTAQVTARVTVDWPGVNPQQVEATAHRPEACQQPTTTTVPPTTTLPPVGLIPPLVIERPSPAVSASVLPVTG